MTATEKCACGATFTLTTRDGATALIALNAWRRDHHCTVREKAKVQAGGPTCRS